MRLTKAQISLLSKVGKTTYNFASIDSEDSSIFLFNEHNCIKINNVITSQSFITPDIKSIAKAAKLSGQDHIISSSGNRVFISTPNSKANIDARIIDENKELRNDQFYKLENSSELVASATVKTSEFKALIKKLTRKVVSLSARGSKVYVSAKSDFSESETELCKIHKHSKNKINLSFDLCKSMKPLNWILSTKAICDEEMVIKFYKNGAIEFAFNSVSLMCIVKDNRASTSLDIKKSKAVFESAKTVVSIARYELLEAKARIVKAAKNSKKVYSLIARIRKLKASYINIESSYKAKIAIDYINAKLKAHEYIEKLMTLEDIDFGKLALVLKLKAKKLEIAQRKAELKQAIAESRSKSSKIENSIATKSIEVSKLEIDLSKKKEALEKAMFNHSISLKPCDGIKIYSKLSSCARSYYTALSSYSNFKRDSLKTFYKAEYKKSVCRDAYAQLN